MSHVKKVSQLLARLLAVCMAMAMAYMLSTVFIGQGNTTMTPEEAGH